MNKIILTTLQLLPLLYGVEIDVAKDVPDQIEWDGSIKVINSGKDEFSITFSRERHPALEQDVILKLVGTSNGHDVIKGNGRFYVIKPPKKDDLEIYPFDSVELGYDKADIAKFEQAADLHQVQQRKLVVTTSTYLCKGDEHANEYSISQFFTISAKEVEVNVNANGLYGYILIDVEKSDSFNVCKVKRFTIK